MRGSEDRRHPLRKIRAMVDRARGELGPWFDRLYSQTGRPTTPPEQLLQALILQLYTIWSERQLMDQIDGNWRYRWFVGLKLDEPVWDVTVFTKNRERLLGGEVLQKFFERVAEQAGAAGLLDEEHFTADGSLIQAWASRFSLRRRRIRRSGGRERGEERCSGTRTKARAICKRASITRTVGRQYSPVI